MASAKRKPETVPAKLPNKRARTESNAKDTPKQEETKPAKTKALSVLTKEQPAFPRGGASLLTPLERKQIRAKAAHDADREQKPTQDLFGNGASKGDPDSDSGDNETADVIPQESTKKRERKQRKSKKSSDPVAAAAKGTELQIGGLSYKRITTGSLILGQIIQVSSRALSVALPNNLVGYVPLTAVSPRLNAKIQKLLAKKGKDEGSSDDEQDDDDEISLVKYFRAGQYLRVAVTATEQDTPRGASATRKRIELSVEPALTNIGIEKSSLVTGLTVQVTVRSVEDTGLVVDLPLGDDKARGFIAKKHLPIGRSLPDIQVGTVLLCHVLNTEPTDNVVKLSADFANSTTLKTASSVDLFLPGTKAEILVSDVTEAGIVGKIMGLLDVTADIVHSGSIKDREAFLTKFQVGSKTTGRLICNFPLSDSKKLGFSVLEDLVELNETPGLTSPSSEKLLPSSTVETATVIRVEPGLGVYLQLDEDSIGFAHMSRLSDKKLDSISEVSGPFKLGSEHDARVLEFNPIDNLYIVSLQKSVLEQRYLRYEDVLLAEVVKGPIEKIVVGADGVLGLLVNLAIGITGFVPRVHMSDVKLDHPEKKFREGQTVTARVLSNDPTRSRLRLTLKKALVNSDQKAWTNFQDIEVGNSTVGTLAKVDEKGAVVRFYGPVKGFLPVSEMSEAFIKDAREHFRVGQVVSVNVLTVNATDKRMTLSCRDINGWKSSIASSLSTLQPGSITNGTVFERSENDILLRLQGSDAIARLTLDHISDGSLNKRRSALAKIRVNQGLENILILQVQERRRLVLVSNKQSLIKAAQNGAFLKGYAELELGGLVTGYIKNITDDGVYVAFAAGIDGLIPKGQVPVDSEEEDNFGLTVMQTVTAKVLNIDYKGAKPRFWLTMRDTTPGPKPQPTEPQPAPAAMMLVDPVDSSLQTVEDLGVGKKTKARIVSVKDTQINVEIAKDVQGRIDVSEVFDEWKDIKDRKRPLKPFYPKLELTVRVLGAHDTRNHRFLPLSHRHGKNTVLELTAKPSSIMSLYLPQLALSDMVVGSPWLAYINNINEECVWVNISPSVRGRIRIIDLSDDLSLAMNLQHNFPLGSAIRVRVLAVDTEKGHLDLTARSDGTASALTLETVKTGFVLPGRVTKITDHNIMVQLSDQVAGAVELLDMADNYDEANPAKYHKNDAIRVCVVGVDAPNKKISLSTRPSKVLSSSMEVTDREFTAIHQLSVNDIVRGFIKNISDKGVFVGLGRVVVAFVRVSNLSDSFLKEWKDQFQRDQLVKGRIVMVDEASGHVQMSLKESALSADYKVPLTFNDLKVGDIVTGKVATVEAFGVFILVDNSERIRGLCHRSEIAEQRVQDATTLFNVGDKVKAKVLKIDPAARKVNFGMKAAYFADAVEEDADSDAVSDDNEVGGGMEIDVDMDDAEDADTNESVLNDEAQSDDDEQDADEDEHEDSSMLDLDADDSEADSSNDEIPAAATRPSNGLAVSGFDWTGLSTTTTPTPKRDLDLSDSEAEPANLKKKKRSRRAEIQVDRTADLDTHGPQSPDDFERLLLTDSDNSALWLQYMAFHLNLGDVETSRALGERALRTISLGLEEEKMNVWIALLNLEVHFSNDDDAIDDTFKRACQVNDPQEIYSRLASIYIKEGRLAKADELFTQMVKKFAQDPKVWINYATFLLDKDPEGQGAEKAHALLPRALQTLPKFTHFDVAKDFARLEFTTEQGVAERGRTLFEGLISSFPKRIDLFDVLLDLEMNVTGDQERAGALFERVFGGGVKLRPKQARGFFKRWEGFASKTGGERAVEEVRARAAAWVAEHAKKE